MKYISALCIVLAVYLGVYAIFIHAAQQRIWTMQACGTLDCVTAFLNKLPPQDALEAKVIVINSQRSFLGSLSDPYYIYYRK